MVATMADTTRNYGRQHAMESGPRGAKTATSCQQLLWNVRLPVTTGTSRMSTRRRPFASHIGWSMVRHGGVMPRHVDSMTWEAQLDNTTSAWPRYGRCTDNSMPRNHQTSDVCVVIMRATNIGPLPTSVPAYE